MLQVLQSSESLGSRGRVCTQFHCGSQVVSERISFGRSNRPAKAEQQHEGSDCRYDGLAALLIPGVHSIVLRKMCFLLNALSSAVQLVLPEPGGIPARELQKSRLRPHVQPEGAKTRKTGENRRK
jgi:hypothetical protein